MTLRVFREVLASGAILAAAAIGFVLVTTFPGHAQAGVEAKAAHSLAPSGRLRVAINLGNPVLAQRDAASGELKGVSVVLARALGKRLKLPVDLIAFDAAGKVFKALEQGEWDVAFLANEPERAQKIAFSSPYVLIDSTYLVRKESRFATVVDLDRAGVRVAVAQGAAYDLFLSRTLKQAELKREPNFAAARKLLDDDQVDALAGIRQALVLLTKERDGYRVLADSFSSVEQAIAVPRGRAAGAAYVERFLKQMKASGAVRAALKASGQDPSTAAR